MCLLPGAVPALHPQISRTVKLPSGEDLAALLAAARGTAADDFVAHGYLRVEAVDGIHRCTANGLAVATLRTAWPGRAILLDRDRREANEPARR